MKSILVIEDHDESRDVLALMLSLEGYAVKTAGDFVSALHIIRSKPTEIGLIVMDWFIPGMSAREFLFQKNLLIPSVRTILQTGNADAFELAREHKIDHVLPKPYNVEQFLGLVQRGMKLDTTLSLSSRTS